MAEEEQIECEWRGCGKRFVPSRPWHKFCCTLHRAREHAARRRDLAGVTPGESIAFIEGKMYRLVRIHDAEADLNQATGGNLDEN